MATSTSNLGLQKPDYSDAADIAVLNGNSDKIDSSVNATDGAIAIVSNGNTHPAIPSGNYVYIRGHGSLSEGLYKNSTSGTIGVNATLSSSNVSAISSGGMNEMKSITNALNGKITSTSLYAGRTSDTTVTLSEPYTNFLFVMITAQTNVDFQCMMIPTSVIASNRNFQFMMSASSNAGQQTYPLQYNSNLAIKFTDSTHCAIGKPTYNNPNWALSVNSIYGVIRK